MSPPDRVGIKEELFPKRRRGKAPRCWPRFTRIEPAERRPEHHESSQEDGAIEIAGKLSAYPVNGDRRAIRRPAFSPQLPVFPQNKESVRKSAPRRNVPARKTSTFEETGSEERALGHGFPFLRWIGRVCNVSRICKLAAGSFRLYPLTV